MKRRILFTAVIVAFFSFSAFAQWKSWGKYKGQTVYYQRLTRERNSVKVWTKKGRVRGYLAFDCSQGKIRQLQVVKNAQVIGSWDDYYVIAPGTFGEWLYNKACP